MGSYPSAAGEVSDMHRDADVVSARRASRSVNVRTVGAACSGERGGEHEPVCVRVYERNEE